MADITLVKISALPAAEQIGAEDLLPVVQEGATKAVAYGVIKDDIANELAPDATLSEAGKAADAKAVGDALALKADKTELTAEVSRIDAALATKANTNDVNAALATKANTDDVTAALALKADTATVNAGLSLKADKTELTAGLATKQNVLTFDSTPTQGSTNPVTSGGIYQAIPALDDTLTVAGDAADAKITGDAITELKNDLDSLQDNLYTTESSSNLLYLNTVKPNYYISDTNGQEVAYNSWGATDFISVVGGEDYVFIGCYSVDGTYENIRTDYFAFYDSQKAFISGSYNSRGIITAPSNAAYIRESTNLPAFTSAMYATMFGLNSDLGSFIGQKTKAYYIEPGTEFIPSEFLENTVNDIVGHTIRVETDGSGNFTNLKSAVEYSATHEDTTIIVGNGTYDLITEFGSSYFENMTSSNQRQGLQIGNGVHIIFSSGAKVTAHYTGDNDAVKTCFSPFNFIQGTKGFTLENLTIEASNVRYIVHDEAGGSATPKHYKNVYKNCNMTIDNSQNTAWSHHQCIGGGLGLHGEIIVEDCIFIDQYNINYRVPAVSYHNAAGSGAKSQIVVKGCWFSNDATVRVSWYGTSTEITEVIVHDNSMTVAPYINAETSGSTVENVMMYAWNNEIRSA